MKKGQEPVRLILIIILFVILIFGSSTIFITQMNGMTYNTTLNTVNEIATHDRISIENFLERNWNELSGVFGRLITYDCDTVLAVQERMSLERSTGSFHTLYLVAEDGTVYNDRYAVYTSDQMDIQSYLVGGRKKIACRYDYLMTTKEEKEMLLYAIALDDFEVEGIKFTYLAGISPINEIQEHLAIYSFFEDGVSRGYTSVLNPNGDYIVNMERTVSINQRKNFYDLLDRGERDVEWTDEAIRASMGRKESFLFIFTNENNVQKFLLFIPIEGVTWYLMASVEQSVFTDLSRTFIFASVSMVIIAIVVSMCMFLLLMQSHKSAMSANADAKARSEFLSNMSHEIRTPLNGITGLLHLMAVHLDDGNREQMLGWLKKANSTAQYLLSLIGDILDMSKLQAGKLVLHMEPFLLESMLDSIEYMQRGNVSSHGVEFILEKDIAVPCIVSDETRLKQVLMNIVGNAAKFTPSGGTIRLSAHQKIEGENRVTTVLICADTGIGMTPEFQKQIWNSFTQEHNKVSNGMRGTGLGMSISKGIIDAMGGEISVVSELGKGSTFTVTFSSEIGECCTPESTNTAVAESVSPSGVSEISRKLLVAEDNELNAEILIEILHDAGYETVLAEDGSKAVEIFAQSEVGEFGAILMDMQMPVMDGCQATMAIRGMARPDAKEITIFACTANSFQDDRDRAMASGMSDFLTKPIDIEKLIAKLETLQEKREG